MLDELTAGLEEPRVYLKLDTQGYDVEVFRGAGTGWTSSSACSPRSR
jgi:hypothetical protein